MPETIELSKAVLTLRIYDTAHQFAAFARTAATSGELKKAFKSYRSEILDLILEPLGSHASADLMEFQDDGRLEIKETTNNRMWRHAPEIRLRLDPSTNDVLEPEPFSGVAAYAYWASIANGGSGFAIANDVHSSQDIQYFDLTQPNWEPILIRNMYRHPKGGERPRYRSLLSIPIIVVCDAVEEPRPKDSQAIWIGVLNVDHAHPNSISTGYGAWLASCAPAIAAVYRANAMWLEELVSKERSVSPISADPRLPAHVRLDAIEAEMCLNKGLFNAFACMARRTVHSICADQGSSGKDLKEEIENLQKDGKFTDEIAKRAQDIRTCGKLGAHPEWDVIAEADAKLVLENLHWLLQVIYLPPPIPGLSARKKRYTVPGRHGK